MFVGKEMIGIFEEFGLTEFPTDSTHIFEFPLRFPSKA
jgi:hypothetical protein